MRKRPRTEIVPARELRSEQSREDRFRLALDKRDPVGRREHADRACRFDRRSGSPDKDLHVRHAAAYERFEQRQAGAQHAEREDVLFRREGGDDLLLDDGGVRSKEMVLENSTLPPVDFCYRAELVRADPFFILELRLGRMVLQIPEVDASHRTIISWGCCESNR